MDGEQAKRGNPNGLRVAQAQPRKLNRSVQVICALILAAEGNISPSQSGSETMFRGHRFDWKVFPIRERLLLLPAHPPPLFQDNKWANDRPVNFHRRQQRFSTGTTLVVQSHRKNRVR